MWQNDNDPIVVTSFVLSMKPILPGILDFTNTRLSKLNIKSFEYIPPEGDDLSIKEIVFQSGGLFHPMKPISSFKGLERFSHLETLDISYNKFSSFDELPYLPRLKILVCNGNPISSLKGLEMCPNIEEIYMKGAIFSSFSQGELPYLPHLRVIHIQEATLNSLKGLISCPNLEELDISGNFELESLEGLEDCSKLRLLNSSHCNIRSLKVIKYNYNLETLRCECNRLNSLKGLEGCPMLEEIYCQGNDIITLQALRRNRHINRLDCSMNLLIDLRGLENSQHIIDIRCQKNSLKSLEGLTPYPGSYLDFRKNRFPQEYILYLQTIGANY